MITRVIKVIAAYENLTFFSTFLRVGSGELQSAPSTVFSTGMDSASIFEHVSTEFLKKY